jgi:mycothiol synthase
MTTPAENPPPPQLRMRHPLKGPPGPIPALPTGYTLRVATAADEVALGVLLTEAFNVPWDIARVHKDLLDDPHVPVTFVIDCGDELVSTASFQYRPEVFERSGWVHWVGSTTRHAGKKLGQIVTMAVVHEGVRRGVPDIYLQTDDFRLPAIKSYLNCGFEPDAWHETHATRWTAVMKELEGKNKK